MLASYDSQATQVLNAYEEEVYLSSESQSYKSSIPAADWNSCRCFGLRTPIKSSENTVQKDSHHSVTVPHDHIDFAPARTMMMKLAFVPSTVGPTIKCIFVDR